VTEATAAVQRLAQLRQELPVCRAFLARVRARVIDPPGGAAGRVGLFTGQAPNVPGHDVVWRALAAELHAMEAEANGR